MALPARVPVALDPSRARNAAARRGARNLPRSGRLVAEYIHDSCAQMTEEAEIGVILLIGHAHPPLVDGGSML